MVNVGKYSIYMEHKGMILGEHANLYAIFLQQFQGEGLKK